MSEKIILALISSAALPALAWFFKDPWKARAAKIADLAKIAKDLEVGDQLEKLVKSELDYEVSRRTPKYKLLMLLVFAAGGAAFVAVLGAISLILMPQGEFIPVPNLVWIAALVTVALFARHFVRTGPEVMDEQTNGSPSQDGAESQPEEQPAQCNATATQNPVTPTGGN